MIISLIAAMTEERVIGREGRLPWHIPADLSRFKSITMGHTLIMGRKTWQSIGRPLPGRSIIVLTRTLPEIEGCRVARSFTEALAAAEGDEEIFVCGGAEVFREAFAFAQRLYLTVVHANFPGDVRFPDVPSGFQELQRTELREVQPVLSFLVYERVERVSADASAPELRNKGREAMQRGLYFLARRCLELAEQVDHAPEAASDLAFSTAKSGGSLPEALALAHKAVVEEPANPRCYLNLGRLQILSGEKEQAVASFREGMQQGDGPELRAELEQLGIRATPLIPSLPRRHPLNKYLGLLLRRLGIK